MTENDIVKVLECCSRNNCSGCPLSKKSMKSCLKIAIKSALDIIKLQKAILGCLEGNDFIQIEANFSEVIRAVKAEAEKEISTRLLLKVQEALKEMVGEDE